jgi:hypothetical protein
MVIHNPKPLFFRPAEKIEPRVVVITNDFDGENFRAQTVTLLRLSRFLKDLVRENHEMGWKNWSAQRQVLAMSLPIYTMDEKIINLAASRLMTSVQRTINRQNQFLDTLKDYLIEPDSEFFPWNPDNIRSIGENYDLAYQAALKVL